MTPTLRFLTIASLLATALPLWSQEAVRQGSLSDVGVRAIAQDAQGRFWFGTAHGLNLMEGSSYTVFYASDKDGSLHNDNIHCLLPDSDGGRLWIGTDNGMAYYDFATGKITHSGSATYNPASFIGELDGDHIVTMGRAGFLKFRKDNLDEKVAQYFEPGMSWLTDILVSSAKDLWFTFRHNGGVSLYVLDKDLRIKDVVPLPTVGEVSGLAETGDGSVWLATDTGLRRFDGGSLREVDVPSYIRDSIGTGKVLLVNAYGDDGILVGVSGQPIRIFRDGQASALEGGITLTDEGYLCYVASSGRILLSDGKIGVRFFGQIVGHRNYGAGDDDIESQGIAHLSFDGDGLLWGRVGESVVCFDPKTGQERWRSPQGGVTCMLIDSRGRFWTGSNDGRLTSHTIEDGTLRRDRSYDFGDGIFSPCEDSDGNIWVALTGDLAYIDTLGQIHHNPGPGVPFTLLLQEDNTRQLFLNTVAHGAYTYSPQDSSFHPLSDRTIENPSYIRYTSDSTAWIGTTDNGLTLYNTHSGEQTVFSTSNYLADNNIRTVLEDSGKNVWFSTTSRIYKWEASTGKIFEVQDLNFDFSHNYNMVSGAVGPDGRLYFGGQGGITVIDPTAEFPEVRRLAPSEEEEESGGASWWIVLLVASCGVAGLLVGRRGQKGKATAEEAEEEAQEEELSPEEQERRAFLTKADAVIDKSLEAFERLSVDLFTERMNMSYSNLYLKMKESTGQTPQAYINARRMDRAMELLKGRRHTVTEIADMVGSSSSFAFAREFKAQFGITPSSVKKQAAAEAEEKAASREEGRNGQETS